MAIDAREDTDAFYVLVVGIIIAALTVFIYVYNQRQSKPNHAYDPSTSASEQGSCQDVTSYDHNWNNDMLCTRLDGSTFYTNYAGAKDYEQGN